MAAEAKVPIWFEPVSVLKSVRHTTISNHVRLVFESLKFLIIKQNFSHLNWSDMLWFVQLMFVSPNEAELVAMAMGADWKPENAYDHLDTNSNVHSLIPVLQPHIERLLGKGIKFVVLTLGGLGVVLCSKLRHLNAAANNDGWLPACNSIKKTAEKQILDNQPSDVCYLHFPALPASVVSLSGAGDCFVAGALAALCMHRGLLASMAFGIAVARHAVQSELNVPSNLSEVNLTGINISK